MGDEDVLLVRSSGEVPEDYTGLVKITLKDNLISEYCWFRDGVPIFNPGLFKGLNHHWPPYDPELKERLNWINSMPSLTQTDIDEGTGPEL